MLDKTPNIKSYEDAEKYLGYKDERPLYLHETRIVRISHGTLQNGKTQGAAIGIYFHGTPLIEYYMDGMILLLVSGHATSTAQKRINRFLPYGVRVITKKNVWYVRQIKYGMAYEEKWNPWVQYYLVDLE